MSFISMRRTYLDSFLERNISFFTGVVLDCGGVKGKRRGSFRPPIKQTQEWIVQNIDPKIQADIISPLPDIALSEDSVDRILCTEVLEYIADVKGTLQSMHRVLRPGGKALITIPFMHPLHGDKEQDKWRLTPTWFRQMASEFFELEHQASMGGVVAVLFDLLKTQWAERGVLIRLLMKLGPFFYGVDRIFCSPHEATTTGMAFILRKK